VFPEELQVMMSEIADEGAQGKLLFQFVANRQKIRSVFHLLKTASMLDRLYLLAVFGCAIVALSIYVIFVFPTLRDFYTSTGNDLPTLVSTLMAVVDWLSVYWWLALLLMVGVLVWSIKAREWLGGYVTNGAPSWIIGIPFLGKRLKLLAEAQGFSMFQILLAHGVEVDRAFAMSRGYIKARGASLEYWLKRVLGAPWRDTLQFYQANDVLEEQMERVGSLIFDEIASKLVRHTRLKSVLALLILGLFVGAWVVAVYLPIFQMGATMSSFVL
jgi:type IV pilus assembly protein PilC